MAHLNRNRAEQAMKDLNRAIKIDPKNAEAYDGRGQAYAKSGDPVKANTDFDKAIELNPKMASAYRHRGENYKALVKSKAGDEVFDRKGDSGQRTRRASRCNRRVDS